MTESADAIDGIAQRLRALPRTLSRRDRTSARLVRRARRSTRRSTCARTRTSSASTDWSSSRAYVQPLAHALATRSESSASARRHGGAHGPRTRRASTIATRSTRCSSPRSKRGVPTPELVSLGRDLFFDTRLSPAGQRSCASCHRADRAFTDGARARDTPGRTRGPRRRTKHADARERRAPADAVRRRPCAHARGSGDRRLGQRGARWVARSRHDASRRRDGRRFVALRDAADHAESRVRLALAAYVRSLVALDSRFDRAMRGDASAMTTRNATASISSWARRVRDVPFRAIVQRRDAADVGRVGAGGDRRSSSTARPGAVMIRTPGGSTYAASTCTLCLQDADAAKHRAHRAIHAQRRVQNARGGGGLLRRRRRARARDSRAADVADGFVAFDAWRRRRRWWRL